MYVMGTACYTYQCTQLQADKANLLDQLQKRGDISNELQQLLMLTYIKEHAHWVNQKSSAEKQLETAKKEVWCEWSSWHVCVVLLLCVV